MVHSPDSLDLLVVSSGYMALPLLLPRHGFVADLRLEGALLHFLLLPSLHLLTLLVDFLLDRGEDVVSVLLETLLVLPIRLV